MGSGLGEQFDMSWVAVRAHRREWDCGDEDPSSEGVEDSGDGEAG